VEAQLPGVRAAVTSDLPIAGASDPDTRIALNPESTFGLVHPTTPWKPDVPQQTAYLHRVSSGYLDVMHISLLAGRNIRADDAVSPQLLDDWDAPRGEGVALVNRAFAVRAFAGAAAALGQRISVQEDFVPARVIVGVVADTHLNRRDSGSAPHVYVPFADGPAERFALVACCADLPPVVRAATPLPGDPFAVRDPTTLTELLRTPFAIERAVTGVIAVLAITALIICAIAIYAVGSAHVRRRERELGIRVALGARHRSLQYDLARATVVQSIGAAVMGVAFSQLVLRQLGYESRGFDLVAS
jgi:hypothetical protein